MIPAISIAPRLVAWSFSGWEIVILLVIVLLLFGRKVPEVARSLGRGILEFKKGLHDVQDEANPMSTPRQQTLPRSGGPSAAKQPEQMGSRSDEGSSTP